MKTKKSTAVCTGTGGQENAPVLHLESASNFTITVNREIFVFKNLRVINFRVKKSSSASGSDEDFLTTKFF